MVEGVGGRHGRDRVCLLLLGLLVSILGPDCGMTPSSTAPLPIPAPPLLSGTRLLTTVTTSPRLP